MSDSSQRTGALGKLPRQADFVRLNAASPLSLQLHRWIEAAVEEAIRGATAPEAPARFLFTAPGQETALVGVVAPSRDSVGRSFPLAVFIEEHAGFLANHLSLIPAAFESFMDAAAALLAEAANLGQDELARRLRALPAPMDASSLGRWRRRVLLERRGAELLGALPQGGAAEARYYALSTFVTGCTAEQHQERGASRIILDCPLAPQLGPLPWLELAARRLRWKHSPPALLWTRGEAPRLWLSLGAATPVLLGQWLHPGARAQIWPLSTQKPQALAQARNALAPSLRFLIDSPTASLEELLDGLAS